MYLQYDVDVQDLTYAKFVMSCVTLFTRRRSLFGRFVLQGFHCFRERKESHMLWTIFVMLLILWLLGLVSSYTLGGYIHLLLVVALIVLLVNLLTGRRGAI